MTPFGRPFRQLANGRLLIFWRSSNNVYIYSTIRPNPDKMKNIRKIIFFTCFVFYFSNAYSLIARPVKGRLSTRLDSLIHTYPAGEPGFAVSIEKKGFVLYRNVTGLADKTTGMTLDTS